MLNQTLQVWFAKPDGMCLYAWVVSVNICGLHGLSNCHFSNSRCLLYVCHTSCITYNRCYCAIYPSTLFCHPATVPDSPLTHLISVQIQESGHLRGVGCNGLCKRSGHRVGFFHSSSHTHITNSQEENFPNLSERYIQPDNEYPHWNVNTGPYM